MTGCTGEGWEYDTIGSLSNGQVCGKCTEKSCADGYTAGLESCPGEGYTYSSNGYSGDEICGMCTKKPCPDGSSVASCKDGTYTQASSTIKGYSGEQACYACTYTCKNEYYANPGQCASGHACTALPEENGLICYKEGGLLQCPTDYKASACAGGTGYTAQETDKIQLNGR